MRRAAKIDANHGNIVAGLRAVGCSVLSLAKVGQGCPDLLVGYRGRNWMLEVKNAANKPSKKRLTPDELAFIESWRGQVAVVECLNDALTVMGITV